VKAQHVTKNWGRHCADIELTTYLGNTTDPGSSSDLNLNGHLHYPNDIDRSLNETAVDKIRKYRAESGN
jgi:hypothetical protein